MSRSGLLTAVAATALLAAPAAFAQTAPAPAQPPQQSTPATSAEPAMPAAQTPAESGTVIDVLREQGRFTTLLAALDRAGLTQTLASRPAISIFAPTDAAFAALSEEERARLLDPANAAELRERLLYHVIVADVASGQIEGTRGGVQTAAQAEVQLDGTGDAIKVDDATVVQADIGAANGAIFAIDRVLDPEHSLAAMGDSEAPDAGAAPADEATEPTPNTPPTLPAERTAPAAAPTNSPSPATTNPAPAAPTAPATAPVAGSAAAPSAGATPEAAPPTTGVTSTTRPATGQTAPNGQPADTVTTVQSPPVHNPTDGQVDDKEDPLNPAPTPDE